MTYAIRSLSAALLVVASAATARAQRADAPFRVGRPTRAEIATDPGSTVSAVFPVANRSSAPATVTPTITLPAGWTLVLGGLPFTIAPDDSDTWIVSVAVPSQAPAGRYVISLAASSGGSATVQDSLVVRVRERHALSVLLLDAPAYAIAGHAYRAVFLVRNRGNGDAHLRVAARDAREASPRLEALSATLAADSSRTIAVMVPTPAVGARAENDVVELGVTDLADTTSRAAASARVTIVPKPGAMDELATVPARLLLRAADHTTGIAPLELSGGGRLGAGSATELAVLARGPGGSTSPFGERDEYQLSLRAPDYRLRAGDQLFGYSPLASSGQMGFGAGGEAATGAFVAGAYAERFRLAREPMSERGVSLALRPGGLAGASQLAVDALSRDGGELPGQVVSSRLRLDAQPGVLDAEYAASRGPLGAGSAGEVRIHGDHGVQYDLEHTVASLGFAGPPRGSMHDVATTSLPLTAEWRLSASASAHETDGALFPFDTTGVPLPSRLRTATLGVVRRDGLSLAYEAASRRDIVPTPGMEGTQQGVTLRALGGLGRARLWGTTELGIMHDAMAERSRSFRDFELGTALDFGANSISVYGQLYQGTSVLRGPMPMHLLGGSASVHLTKTMTLTAFGSASAGQAILGTYSLVDARLSQQLPSGATISLRTRLAGGRANIFGAGRLLFLEYALPLRVPVGPLRDPGRVRGRIVNGETGRGVPGALVRLGSEAAITDADGRVSFSGLPAGRYDVSLTQNMALANSAVDGNPVVLVDSAHHAPATFRLAVARGAKVTGTVRRMIVARTGVGGQADSIVDAGPMRDVVIALVSGADTVYRATDGSGAFLFDELPARRWTLSVITEPSRDAAFEPGHVQLVLVPGQSARVDIRMKPKHRAVHIIDSDDTPLELRPAPARPAVPARPPGATGRPTG